MLLLQQETAIPVCSQQHLDQYGQPESLLATSLAAERLKPALAVEVKMQEALYLLTPQGKGQISPQAQLFKQWLIEQA